MTLEICTGTIESVLAAKAGGAQRVELCSALSEGGLTPSRGLIRAARKVEGIKLHVLIRPRSGDFLYTPEEVEVMLDDIALAREEGADGVVIGALTAEGDVDMTVCQRLVDAAEGMNVTYHRAFDMCRNPEKALEDIISLGCNTLLTSGQRHTAEEGMPLLKQLVIQADGRIEIMPGAGVSPENASRIKNECHVNEIHASARSIRNSKMQYRNQLAAMGDPSQDEYAVKETDASIVRRIISTLLLCLCFIVAKADIHDDFISRQQTMQGVSVFDVFSQQMSKEEREAMEFLYAYMPLPDMTDHDGEFYLANTRLALQARKEMKWGRRVPKREWRHFVLPVRVNNEDMDMSREAFYSELRNRVKGLSMKEAALEVNHWCHEKVTYTPSDSRTSAPLATMRNALGRCGEESTFCVAAMRSVGIPARQVYTPRWAHTDDNHAWVEVWVDGKWHFLGACEPEAVLDLGWFNAPASRGMLMHTKVFGNYDGPEEVMSRNNCFTEIDVTANYAPVSEAIVRCVDADGQPVAALVEYKLYNYAEFYTVATKQADENGVSKLTAGRGDLLIWASCNGKFGFAKYSVGKDKEVTVKLNHTAGYMGKLNLDITPPVERNTIPKQTKKQIETNKQRLAHEDAVRNAYTSIFVTKTQADKMAEVLLLDADRVNAIFACARGNYKVIAEFLMRHHTEKALALLESLSQKDLHDVTLDVLEDHLFNTPEFALNDMERMYLLSPRISNELLTPWRKSLQQLLVSEGLQQAGVAQPELLVRWVKENIVIDNLWNPQRLCMAPQSVARWRVADAHSRDIFFVAMARSCGVMARIDEVTGKTQYMKKDGEQWTDVVWQEQQQAETAKGMLRAAYDNDSHIENPKYYTHFTISRLVDDRLQLMAYPEEGVTWQSLLRDGEVMDEGFYVITTGTRMANGSVLVHMEFVPVFKGGITDVQLQMRHDDNAVQVIGAFNSENLYDDAERGRKSLLSTTGRGYYVVGIVAPNNEPTNHALRDIALLAKDFEKWGQKLVILFADKDAEARFQNKEDFILPSTVVWGTDVDNKISDELRRELHLTDAELPVFAICDTFNRVVFVSSGYTIGLGEQMMGVIKKLGD